MILDLQVMESTVDACKVVEACLTCTDLRFFSFHICLYVFFFVFVFVSVFVFESVCRPKPTSQFTCTEFMFHNLRCSHPLCLHLRWSHLLCLHLRWSHPLCLYLRWSHISCLHMPLHLAIAPPTSDPYLITIRHLPKQTSSYEILNVKLMT